MEYVLGISDSHDSGAALINTAGEVVYAINEERLCRRKLITGMPYRSLEMILQETGIDPAQIREVALASLDFAGALYMNSGAYHRNLSRMGRRFSPAGFLADLFYYPAVWFYRSRFLVFLGSLYRPYKRRLRAWLKRKGVTAPITMVEHHTAHAAGAYFTGGRKQGLVVTIDSSGDSLAATVSLGREGRLFPLYSQKWPDTPATFYGKITQLLGFRPLRHEGKVLGLAASGRPEPLLPLFRRLVRFDPARKGFACRWFLGSYSFGVRKLAALTRGHAREDIAAAAQQVSEETTCAFIREWIKTSGETNLLLAGGLFANVKINQKLLELAEVNSLFVHPHMGDGGLGLGAAYALLADKKNIPPRRLKHVYWGRAYPEARLTAVLEQAGLPYIAPPDPAGYIAERLAAGRIVGLFQGRMEYGPRALGNRSILANPADPGLNDWLNQRLNRTEFMPFAPVVCREEAETCYPGFTAGEYPARFMTITFAVAEETRRLAPAVCHIDNTARPQVITAEDNPLYYAILKAFHRHTGIPVLVNTSFNLHEEPIVCSPEDALTAFRRGAIDLLVLGKYIVEAAEPVTGPHPAVSHRQV